jgi:hypothetical protein
MGFLLLIALALVVDMLVALFAMWLGPLTGLFFLADLSYWNWFAIVILTQVLSWTATARS